VFKYLVSDRKDRKVYFDSQSLEYWKRNILPRVSLFDLWNPEDKLHLSYTARKKSLTKLANPLISLVPRDRILIALGDRMHQRRTSNRHGDFLTKFLKI
jgi:hypothetical protein